MSTATKTRYLVRAAADAPEKGPYTIDQIKQSHSKGLLKDGALVRGEHASLDETRTVKDLVEEGDVARATMLAGFKRDDEERAFERARSGGGTNMAIGAFMMILGVVLSLASFGSASGGGRYMVFTGLVVFGLIRFIRGVAAR